METMSFQSPTPKPQATISGRPSGANHHGLHDHSAQGQSLEGALQQAGASHLAGIYFAANTVDELRAQMRLFAKHVLPSFAADD